MLKFVCADIYGAAVDAGIAVQVRGGSHIGFVPGIDARGVGLQAKAAIDRERRIGDVANTIGWHWCRTTIMQNSRVVVIRSVVVKRVEVVVKNAVIEHAG